MHGLDPVARQMGAVDGRFEMREERRHASFVPDVPRFRQSVSVSIPIVVIDVGMIIASAQKKTGVAVRRRRSRRLTLSARLHLAGDSY